ncbi:hypothetical protein C8J57DRAFT_1575548 [Mycena rebaudengoi]|nr:hypothetical protein C8J57DRAFT_1575548 [Mycena rebaudengoi]
MPTTENFKNVMEYTILAATTAKNIAETAKVPFLGSTSTLCLSITKCIETTKLNKEECAEMIEHIHEILCIIIQLHTTSEIKGVLPTAVLYDIAKFTEALEMLFTIVNGQQKGTLGKIKGLFRQPEVAERLEKCKQELSRMVELFKAQVTGSTLSPMGQMKKDAKEQHERLVALLETDFDLSSSDRSSELLAKLGKNNSSGSFGLLLASPKIFHGHEAELQDVVSILVQDFAHIAILGTGGMGKTSLATAALHNQLVESKYSHRYFVPCHSSPTCTELAATIADHIGLEKGSNMVKKIAHYFAHAPPSLLILDNLETPWESLSSRSEVEEFLSLLTDVPHLGLMVSDVKVLNDQAKLNGPSLSCPPLKPLSNMAAWQTFIEVADDGYDDTRIKELLELTGNLPLAVSLMASVAGSEGCAQAISRWKLESTQMLSDGYDQRLNLDISIMLSYTSTRMTLDAQELLSILSLLPDGLTTTDLVQAKLPITDILACRTTLIRTSLAFVDQDQHLKVLAPIREHILHIHPPANILKLKLRDHFHQILDLYNRFRNLDVGDILPRISRNLGNFNIVQPEGPDIVQIFRSILFLNHFYSRIHSTYSPLLLQLSGQLLHWKSNPIFGECLTQLLETSPILPHQDFDTDITLGTQYFKSKDPLEQARWYCALGAYFCGAKSDLVEALKYFQRAHSLAESIRYPTTVGQLALSSISSILNLIGKPLSALTHAKEAYRLGDLSTGMNDIPTTLRWAVILLGQVVKSKDKLQTTQAFRCLGQILAAEGDNKTALTLFTVALDGFTFMDVHRWRADCMVQIADILNNHGEAMKAVELWNAARPLFERSSQMKDMVNIDAKLAKVDSAVLAEYAEQLQRLSELHVPRSGPEETFIVEGEEEEGKDILAEESDLGDKGKEGVLA